MNNTVVTWKKIKDRSLSNLHVMFVDGNEIGFVYKPVDTKTDKNAWRSHLGIGESTIFLGHDYNKTDAKNRVEHAKGLK
jgi:hypothetical protein